MSSGRFPAHGCLGGNRAKEGKGRAVVGWREWRRLKAMRKENILIREDALSLDRRRGAPSSRGERRRNSFVTTMF